MHVHSSLSTLNVFSQAPLLVLLWIYPYSLDQMLLSISRLSRIVAAPSDVLNEIDAALEY